MNSEVATVPEPVVAAWGWESSAITPLPGGLIDASFAVRGPEATPIAVLQRLHPSFDAKVNLDLEAVTSHLAAHGRITPLLIRTRDGRACWDHEGVWRALTWVDGETVHAIPDPSWAEAAGALVGDFHRAVADLRRDYAFVRAGVHDTAAHLAALRALSAAAQADDEGRELARAILDATRSIPELPPVPRRHCHGDLKISNVLFQRDPLRGICLVDLDTLGQSTIALELGDAMRSWCNPRGEDAGSVTFDLAIFAAAIRGFRGVADELVAREERSSIVIGLELVCLELAARFAVDVFRDDYFGWDPKRFATRRAHNLVRARGQLALGLAVRAARADALDIVLGQ